MKILLLNSEYPPVGGGASNASAAMARNFAELGHDVTVMTTRFGNLPAEETLEGVHIVRIPSRRAFKDRSGPLEQLFFVVIGCLWGVPLVHKFKPDVVLAFFGAPSGIVALTIKLLLGYPYIVSLRGGDVPGFRPYDFALYHKMLGPLLHLVWRQAAFVVANSQGLCNLGQAFDSKVPIQIIPNGVEISQFTPPKREWLPARLLIAGRVVHQKGIDILLAALAGLKDLDWKLTIAGDGPLLPSLQAQAEALGLNGRVRFLGWQEKNQMVINYQQANLFTNPSRDEGMPNVVLEAMASGLPVVATRIAGSEELVIPGETGLLVPPEDVEAVRAALRELIPNGDLRREMGAAARQRVETHYTWRSVAKQNLELLRKAAEKK